MEGMVLAEVIRLGAALGAEIRGIDLARPLSDENVQLIQEAFLAHQVIVFRDQELKPDDLVAFGNHMGELTEHPQFPHLDGYPPIVVIKNYGKDYSLNEHWHSDVMFAQQPPSATLLYALEMPSVGGDTQFANQYLAYERLSKGMQALLEGIRALNSGAGTAKLAGKSGVSVPESFHPIIRTHPDTGRKALFACRAFTRQLEGMSELESAPLLGMLFQHSAKYEFTWRHQWRPGDLVMWDNRCVLHYAIHDHEDAPRLLHRCTLAGEIPV